MRLSHVQTQFFFVIFVVLFLLRFVTNDQTPSSFLETQQMWYASERECYGGVQTTFKLRTSLLRG